jgi:hypothetical protein
MDENVVPKKMDKLPWHVRNRERHKENCKRWREANKTKHKEFCDNWIENNKERYNSNHRRTQRVYDEKQRKKKKIEGTGTINYYTYV